MMDFPQWQLHRGYWKGGVRENTLMAFEEATKKQCKMVELDVQLSREGVPFVFHDFSLKRFFHIDQTLGRTLSDDLEALNIPPLEKVLKSEKVPSAINVEIKSIDIFCRRVAGKVCDCLKIHGANKKLLVSSFNPMVLFWCSRFLPKMPRALLVHEPHQLMSLKFKISMKLADPHFINCHFGLVDHEETRERLLSFGRPIMVWTVNDYDRAAFYLARGAKSVISDLPPKTN